MKIQTKSLFTLRDLCFDYSKAQLLAILFEPESLYDLIKESEDETQKPKAAPVLEAPPTINTAFANMLNMDAGGQSSAGEEVPPTISTLAAPPTISGGPPTLSGPNAVKLKTSPSPGMAPTFGGANLVPSTVDDDAAQISETEAINRVDQEMQDGDDDDDIDLGVDNANFGNEKPPSPQDE